jgi:hypothetical protein
MSVDNSELLMLLGGKKSKSLIGRAGQKGFGVGVYGGDPADLTAMGLAPMEGCEDPTSDNYGNYIHTNGSIMCCIPAFCYRLGKATAPSYSQDGVDALEIKDATKFPQFSHDAVFSSPDFGDDWILHRAFVDGNKLKRAFFIDKYLCSNVNGQAASVKKADRLMCYDDKTQTYFTKSISGTVGQAYDAITLSRARGDYYSLVTCYQWSAISLLSLAHGQAATSADACAWYDANHTTNFPKGATSEYGRDFNDDSIRYTYHSYGNIFAKTGSGTPFNKTTHNGQASGVADVAGVCNQWTIGACNPLQATVALMNITTTAHEITKDNVVDQQLHTSYSTGFGDEQRSFNGIRNGTSGLDWVGAGIIPKTASTNALFGGDEYREYYTTTIGLKVGLGGTWGQYAGIFCRSWAGISNNYRWYKPSHYFGFRSAAYPP